VQLKQGAKLIKINLIFNLSRLGSATIIRFATVIPILFVYFAASKKKGWNW